MASTKKRSDCKFERKKTITCSEAVRGISDCCAVSSLLRNIRSRGQKMFGKNGFPKNFAKLTGKDLEFFFSNKVADPRPATSLKKRSDVGVLL